MPKDKLVHDSFYHVYNHANGFEKLFLEDTNYEFFLSRWKKYINPIAYPIAYCLMSNHFHFLIKIKSVKDLQLQGLENLGAVGQNRYLSQSFSNCFNSYTKAFNKRYKRIGSLFAPNYNRKEIKTTDYLNTIINYIHQNPVKHKYANYPDEWKYSSIHCFEYLEQMNKLSLAEWKKEDYLNNYTKGIIVISNVLLDKF